MSQRRSLIERIFSHWKMFIKSTRRKLSDRFFVINHLMNGEDLVPDQTSLKCCPLRIEWLDQHEQIFYWPGNLIEKELWFQLDFISNKNENYHNSCSKDGTLFFSRSQLKQIRNPNEQNEFCHIRYQKKICISSRYINVQSKLIFKKCRCILRCHWNVKNRWHDSMNWWKAFLFSFDMFIWECTNKREIWLQ